MLTLFILAADAEKMMMLRRIENLQKFLHREKEARLAAESKLADAEQLSLVQSSQLESTRQQLKQMQHLLQKAGNMQESHLSANAKVCVVVHRLMADAHIFCFCTCHSIEHLSGRNNMPCT